MQWGCYVKCVGNNKHQQHMTANRTRPVEWKTQIYRYGKDTKIDIVGINDAFNRLFMRMLNIVVTEAEQYHGLIKWEYGYIDELKEVMEVTKESTQYKSYSNAKIQEGKKIQETSIYQEMIQSSFKCNDKSNEKDTKTNSINQKIN